MFMSPLGPRSSARTAQDLRELAFALPRLALPLAGVVLLGLFLGGIAFNARRINPLGKFKTELKARGEKLTFAELAPLGRTNADPAAAQLTAAGASLGQYRLCPGALDLMVYVGPGRAQVAWKQDSPPWTGGAGPAATWEEFNTQVAEAGPTLAFLRQLLTNPPAHWGSGGMPPRGVVPNYVSLRLSAQWLSGEAISHLRQGRLRQALEDLEGLANCAQVNREDLFLVSQMIRVAVAGLGLSASWEALQAPGWTEPELERLQKAWEPVDLIAAVERGFIGVRAEGEEIWTQAHRMTGRQLRLTQLGTGPTNTSLATIFTDYVQFPVYRLTRIDDDELFFLRSAQDSLDRIRRIKAGLPWVELEDGLSVGATKLNQLSWFEARFGFLISMSVMPNFTRAVQHAAQGETLRQLTLAAIALKRFRLRHGCLPPNLAVLSPGFLARPTYDPMSGKQLEYTLKDDGGFLLYSAGRDHRDDGGERPFWFRGKFGLWDDLDAVWPEPETTELAASNR